MDYRCLLDVTTELGYQLAMSGAETYRIEESITRIFAAYGITAEVFAIPNCLTVSLETEAQSQQKNLFRKTGAFCCRPMAPGGNQRTPSVFPLDLCIGKYSLRCRLHFGIQW